MTDATGSLKEELLARLEKGASDERREAARDLWRYRGADTIKHLIQALGDEEEPVRWWSAFTLGRLRARPAVPALIDHALDREEDSEVREACMMSLGQIGDCRATPALVGLLTDPSPEIQERACIELGEIADVGAAPALLGAANSEHWNVRWSAALALWRMRAPDAREILVRLENDTTIPESLRAEIPEMISEMAQG